MRLDSCKEFNVEKFIKKVNGEWKKEKQHYIEQLESISELPSINNESGVHSTEVSDPTAKQTLDRLKIEYEIEDIEWCEEVYQMAKSRLTPAERELFEGFFEPKGKKMWQFVDEQCEKNYITKSGIYRKRQEVVDKYREIVETHYL